MIPESEYDDYVTKQRQKILDHHFKTTAFYKSFCNNAKPKRWEDIPILTKSDLQVPLVNRLSSDFKLKNLYVNKTSGSSGHPFTFAKDKFCHALTWANVIQKFGWYDIDFNKSYQARFYGVPLDSFGYYKERFKDVLAKRFRFTIFNLNDDVFTKYLEHFKIKKFDYLNGYTSSLVLFAKYLKENNLILKDICPTLKVCITTSEMLFEDDKLLLQNYFGVPIVNEYGASEFGVIAFQEPKGALQICTENLYVEILDDDNNVLPYGETGKIIITDFYNEAHPLIRFEVGDRGAVKKGSSSKFLYLESLEGRTSDIAELPSGKMVPGLTFYYVTKSIMNDEAHVKEFVVSQESCDTFKITYVSPKELNHKELHKIQAAMDRYLEPGLNLKINRVSVLERSKTGKLKQFQKNF